MKKIVLISDSPYATTGLGRVSKSLLKMFPDYEWIIWGFHHPDFNIRKGRMLPAYKKEDFEAKFEICSPKSYTDDQFGLEFVVDFIRMQNPDIIFTSMDYDKTFSIAEQIKELQFTQEFKWINYFPMDREDFKRLEIDAFRYADVNVCISKFGVEKMKSISPKIQIEQIYHAIDASEFPMLSKAEINEFKMNTWKSVQEDTFFAGTVNRSFARKDTARLVVIFSEFLKKTKNTFAYLHGSRMTFEGTDLQKLSLENETPPKRLSFMPDNISEVDAIPQDILNKIYQSLDLFVTVSSGEGFGYTTVEALLTETPIIAPRNTCFPELMEDFGYLVDTSGMAFLYNSNTSMWPIVNVNDVVEKMLYVIDNYEEAKEKAKKGRQWVIDNLNLDVIAEQWRKILES